MTTGQDRWEDDRRAPLLPKGSVAARAASWLTARTAEVYLVGGHIRDWLLGRDSHDADFVVPEESLLLARGLADHLKGHFVPLDRTRGIARVVCYEGPQAIYVDVTLLQGETLAEDLRRRDFTVNAIAHRMGEEETRLIDPHGGREDVSRRLIRTVTPSAFADDPLRLLRAVRLAAELEFTIESQTEALLREQASLIALPAVERIRYELVKVLRTPAAPQWARFLVEACLLARIVPQLEPHFGLSMKVFERTHRLITGLRGGEPGLAGLEAVAPFAEELLGHLSQPTNEERCREDVLRMAALLCPLPPDEVRRALLELRFSGYEARSAEIITAHCGEVYQLLGQEMSRGLAYRFFHDAEDAGVESLLLAVAWESESQKRARLVEGAGQLLEAYFRCYEEVISPLPLLDGHTVMRELNLQPGPQVGELLAALREAQALGQVQTREEALSFVRRLPVERL